MARKVLNPCRKYLDHEDCTRTGKHRGDADGDIKEQKTKTQNKTMQIGWVDFSDKDRQKALEVLKMGQVQGAIDELGIGVIRDAFANYFFPGTSTVQTRAKYFFLVPYIIYKECENGKNISLQAIRNAIDAHERRCAETLIANGYTDGVIGANVLPDKWVKRRPSEIYWNGIKTYGIVKMDCSIDECITIAMRSRQRKERMKNDGKMREENDEGSSDDTMGQAGGPQLWNMPSIGYGEWEKQLSINLTQDEATTLRTQISEKAGGSLLSYLLRNHINVSEIANFSTLCAVLQTKDDLDNEQKDMLRLADWFSKLCYVTRIAYNMMLGTVDAEDEWEKRPKFDVPALRLEGRQNLSQIYHKLNLQENYRNRKTKDYLGKVIDSLCSKSMDRLYTTIRDREVSLKGRERAKTLHPEDYHGGETWLGGRELDYRFTQTKRMINDIYQGEENNA